MAGFRTEARCARDPSLPTARRVWALRRCLTAFHPYGYEATMRRITAGRRIATHAHGTTDPADLVSAIDELDTARQVWLGGVGWYARRRRREKAEGRRAPRPDDCWPYPIAYCPDPAVYPTEPVAEVMRRVVQARFNRTPGCPNCGGTDTVRRRHYTMHGLRRTCRVCGIQC